MPSSSRVRGYGAPAVRSVLWFGVRWWRPGRRTTVSWDPSVQRHSAASPGAPTADAAVVDDQLDGPVPNRAQRVAQLPEEGRRKGERNVGTELGAGLSRRVHIEPYIVYLLDRVKRQNAYPPLGLRAASGRHYLSHCTAILYALRFRGIWAEGSLAVVGNSYGDRHTRPHRGYSRSRPAPPSWRCGRRRSPRHGSPRRGRTPSGWRMAPGQGGRRTSGRSGRERWWRDREPGDIPALPLPAQEDSLVLEPEENGLQKLGRDLLGTGEVGDAHRITGLMIREGEER